MKLFYGCSQWGYQNWLGSLYPENINSSEMLRYYAKLFNSVELNPTFYNGADPVSVRTWKNKVGAGFRFCPKLPRTISHEKNFRDSTEDLSGFLKGVSVFGENLGTIFIQLSTHFSGEDIHILSSFLESVSVDFSVSVEPRMNILSEPDKLNALLSVLKEKKTGDVLTDSVETRPYLNIVRLTNHTAFIRFIAYGHETDFGRLDDWFGQLKKWSDKGLPQAYLFLHFPSDNQDPDLVKYFLDKVSTHCEKPGCFIQR